MIMKKNTLYIAGLAALSLGACKPALSPVAPEAGRADFSRYVAVGNSLTAGYADGTLYRSGQLNAYPNILATQFRLAGGGEFKIPLLPGEWGWPDAKLVLTYSTPACSQTPSLMPKPFSEKPDTAGSAINISAQGPFNNLGVPGIRAIDFLFQGYGYLNPYASRFYVNPLGNRPLDELSRITPTFFTLWIGNNDVLGYATSGGEGSPSGIFPNDISPVANFKAGFDSVLRVMTRSGAKGVVINIPDVTAIAYFNTVTPNGLTLSADQAKQANGFYAAQGITGFQFVEGVNNFVIEDPAVAGTHRRFIRNDELLLLTTPQDSIRCAGWGTVKPIPKRYVLDATEIANVRSATAAFNQIMAQGAFDKKVAYVDMNSFLKTVRAGIMFNGVGYNTMFVQGGAFSLDGVHLTPRGNALVANEIIRTINNYYGATLPAADINSYPGIRFP